MAYTIEHSSPAMHAESQLFTVPVTYTDRWKSEWERIHPKTTFEEDGSSGDICFYLPPSSNGMLDLDSVTLELELAIKVKTKDTNWTFMGTQDLAAPVNNILHSLFQDVKVTLGNRTISDASCNYAYRSYMESLLFHTRDNADSVLSNAGFKIDTAGAFNNLDTNLGATWRRTVFSRGDFVQLSGKLSCDIFQQDKPLLHGVPMEVRLVPNKKEFFLQVWDPQVDKQFKIAIRNPRLNVKRYVPAPDYMIKITEELQAKTAKYAIERTIVRNTTISRGVQSTIVSNLHIGALPKVVLIGFVASEDFSGKIGRNPFNFQHYNVNQISVEVDGQSYPTKPYVVDFQRHHYLEAYDGLLNTLGERHTPFGQMQFDREAYSSGHTIFGFDLTPGSTGRGPMTLIKQGSLSVSVSFATPLPDVVMMISMLVYDNLIEINQHRQVIADFTA